MTLLAINKRKWFGTLAWVFLFGFFFSVSNYFQPITNAFINSSIETIFLFLVFKTNKSFVFPRYFDNNRRYLFISIVVVLSFATLFYLFDTYVVPRVPNIKHSPRPEFFHWMRNFVVTSFIYFVATSTCLIEHNSRLVENERLLTREKLETELKLLKAQINPHFIFNALNNIYSLTYTKAKNAPDAVLKLSEMLRYVFYECNKDRVPISAEIKYIENYTSFQQMKSDFTQNITLHNGNGGKNIEIAPMLFIPFIENAFKYSRIEEDKDAFVNIMLATGEDNIEFSVVNSVDNNKPLQGSGTGIKNVQYRLDIIYPGKHKLKITEKEGMYTVKLQLETMNELRT